MTIGTALIMFKPLRARVPSLKSRRCCFFSFALVAFRVFPHPHQILLDADEKKVVFAHPNDAWRTRLPRYQHGFERVVTVHACLLSWRCCRRRVILGHLSDSVTCARAFVVAAVELSSTPLGDVLGSTRNVGCVWRQRNFGVKNRQLRLPPYLKHFWFYSSGVARCWRAWLH